MRRHPEKLDAAHRVFAGTINGRGALKVVVTRRSDETTLARVVELISEAETERLPTQRFTTGQGDPSGAGAPRWVTGDEAPF